MYCDEAARILQNLEIPNMPKCVTFVTPSWGRRPWTLGVRGSGVLSRGRRPWTLGVGGSGVFSMHSVEIESHTQFFKS